MNFQEKFFLMLFTGILFLFFSANNILAAESYRSSSGRGRYFDSSRKSSSHFFESKRGQYWGLSFGEIEAEVPEGEASGSWEFSNFEVRSGHKFTKNFAMETRFGITNGISESIVYYDSYLNANEVMRFRYDLLYLSVFSRLKLNTPFIEPYGLAGLTFGREEARLSNSYARITEEAYWLELSYGAGFNVSTGISGLDVFAEYIVYGESKEIINAVDVNIKLSAVNFGLKYVFKPLGTADDSQKHEQRDRQSIKFDYDISPELKVDEKEKGRKRLPFFMEKSDIGFLQWKVSEQIDFNIEMLEEVINKNSNHEITVYDDNPTVEKVILEGSIEKHIFENWFNRLNKDFIVIGQLNKIDSAYEVEFLIINVEQRMKYRKTADSLPSLIEQVSDIIINF